MDTFIAGLVTATALLSNTKPRINPKERALVCNSLQQTYTKEKFTPSVYNWCLEYGPEDALLHYSGRLQ